LAGAMAFNGYLGCLTHALEPTYPCAKTKYVSYDD